MDATGVGPTRVGLPWLLAGAGGGLCMVVAITTRRPGGLLVSPGAVEWSDAWLLPTLAPALAVLGGLVLLRWWPWLLLAGTGLSAPVLLVSSHPYASEIGVGAGAALVLLAVLAAAQELILTGRPGLGAAVAGATVGAVLVGGTLIGASWVRLPSDLTVVRQGLVALGLTGAVAMIARRPRGGRIGVADISLADVLPALLVFLPAVVHAQPISGLLGLDDGVVRRGYLLTAAVGVVTLAVAGLVVALAGPRACVAAVTAALVQVGVAVPVLVAFTRLAQWPSLSVAAALGGVAVGAGAALTRWRTGLAVFGGGVAAVLVASTAGLGARAEVVDTRRAVLTAVLLGLLVATATVTVAATAPVAALRGRLPAILGPIVAALVIGGNQVLHGWYIADHSAVNPTGGDRLGTSVTLLVAAAVAALCLVAVSPRRLPARVENNREPRTGAATLVDDERHRRLM
jgi:hypothetical protein